MTRGRMVAWGAFGAAVAVAVVVLLTGGGDGYIVRAEFKDAGGLRKNSSVKVAGVPAGKVLDIEVTPRDTAIATLRIDSDAAPIGRGASIQVRPTDLLGERYAELSPGDSGHPLPSGSLISESRTSEPVELDDILNMLDPDTRTRLGILVNEMGVALDGRGTDLNRLLSELPPSLDQTRQLIDQVSSQNVALKDAIVRGDRITAAVNGRRDDLGPLIDTANGALTTVAQKRRELGATITNAPATLGELRTTLGHLDTASVALRPTATALQRTAAPLGATLRALPRFASEAAPTLDTATAVAPALTRLGREATPTVARLRPTADLLARTLVAAAPALQHMTDRGTNDLLYFISNMNRALAGRDGIGHFIGAKIYLNSEMVTNAINAFNGLDPTSVAGHGATGAPALGLPAKPLAPLTAAAQSTTAPLGQTIKKVQSVVGTAQATGGDAVRLYNYLMGP